MLNGSLTRQHYRPDAFAAAQFKAPQSFGKHKPVSVHMHELNAESMEYSSHASNASECRCVLKDTFDWHRAACSLVFDSLWQTYSKTLTIQSVCSVCRMFVESEATAAPSDADRLGWGETVRIQ